ncbi:hypothetical protein BHE74_00015732 [Ensete ventricosum]|uniref:Uncharacterized protein n=1 Tax=Ensete ventricosum TaxID=4639 RepID=A0A444DLU2_ENSVE|nr:hypothetical protein GW17_00038011 [Ensete ventricosum]RWW76187.1 hypothetical protein BHE74_00015732 [Ensete ventricosum]RZR71731.1 hypothetical protein BHM03_00006935 [Ensete ventricosum]
MRVWCRKAPKRFFWGQKLQVSVSLYLRQVTVFKKSNRPISWVGFYFREIEQHRVGPNWSIFSNPKSEISTSVPDGPIQMLPIALDGDRVPPCPSSTTAHLLRDGKRDLFPIRFRTIAMG